MCANGVAVKAAPLGAYACYCLGLGGRVPEGRAPGLAAGLAPAGRAPGRAVGLAPAGRAPGLAAGLAPAGRAPGLAADLAPAGRAPGLRLAMRFTRSVTLRTTRCGFLAFSALSLAISPLF